MLSRIVARGFLSQSTTCGSFLRSKPSSVTAAATTSSRLSSSWRQFSAQVHMDDADPLLTTAAQPKPTNPVPLERKLYTFHPGLSDQCTILDQPLIVPPPATRLFVHHIPPNATTELGIAKMFLSTTNIHPIAVEEIDYSKRFGWTYVDFRSQEHADLAFESLNGRATVDNAERLQKRVVITKTGDYVHVRKNTRVPKAQ